MHEVYFYFFLSIKTFLPSYGSLCEQPPSRSESQITDTTFLPHALMFVCACGHGLGSLIKEETWTSFSFRHFSPTGSHFQGKHYITDELKYSWGENRVCPFLLESLKFKRSLQCFYHSLPIYMLFFVVVVSKKNQSWGQWERNFKCMCLKWISNFIHLWSPTSIAQSSGGINTYCFQAAGDA